MKVSERKVGNAVVVDVTGKMISTDSPGLLKDKITSLVFQGEKQIVLNLGDVSYVDSAGLGEMIACHGTATRAGAEVKLANVGKRIKDLLIMTRLVTVFDAHDSEDAAVQSFASR